MENKQTEFLVHIPVVQEQKTIDTSILAKEYLYWYKNGLCKNVRDFVEEYLYRTSIFFNEWETDPWLNKIVELIQKQVDGKLPPVDKPAPNLDFTAHYSFDVNVEDAVRDYLEIRQSELANCYDMSIGLRRCQTIEQYVNWYFDSFDNDTFNINWCDNIEDIKKTLCEKMRERLPDGIK